MKLTLFEVGDKIMFIHTVKKNESLYVLSKQYSVPLDYILDVNHLSDEDRLVEGQALLIPILHNQATYKVKTNETLASIAQMFGVTMSSLMQMNRIQNPALLKRGMLLNIPNLNRSSIEVNAYVNNLNEEALDALAYNSECLTYMSLFSYAIRDTGELVPLNDESMITEAYAQHVTPMLSVTNIENEEFSQSLMHTLLSNEELQTSTIRNIVNTMNEKGFRALNLDFEYISPFMSKTYHQFLTRLAEAVHEEGYVISSALTPQLQDNQRDTINDPHSYYKNGEILDFVIIMTYEWGWTGGPPYPVAPLNEIKKVMEYATSRIPPHKLMMSIPLYGYDWTLPYVEGESRATALSEQEALAIARHYDVKIEYDSLAQSPYFTYVDEQQQQHVVWFEDARSYQAKMNLVKVLNLRGISYWKLTMPAPTNWIVLSENFLISKQQ